MASFNVTVEDSSPLISYQPANAWTDTTRTDDSVSFYSGNSFHVTSQQGATATFTFKGTGFYIYGARRPTYGPYTVSIDGVVIASGEAHAGDAEFETLLGSRTGMEYGEHTAVVTNTGAGSAVDIDKVDFVGQVGSTGTMQTTIYDDTDPAITYGPSQAAWTIDQGPHMNGTLHVSNTSGASASLEFSGNAVAIYTSMASNRADVTVTLDGKSSVISGGSKGVVDSLHLQTLMYYVDGLDSSRHSLLINSDAQTKETPFLDLDRIVVFTAQPQQASSSSAGLSTGVIAGIAAAGAAGLLLLGVGIFFLLRMRRKRRSLNERENSRASSPDSPMGRLPMQDPMMLEAGAVRPGVTWTPPTITREPSYHHKHQRSASRNGSISAVSLQSSSTLLAPGVPKGAISRNNSALFNDPSRAPSAMSYGDMDSSASTLNPMFPESQPGGLPFPAGSQWDDSDSETPALKVSKKASKASLRQVHSRNNSLSSQSNVPSDPRAFPAVPRDRSRSRTRDDANDTDGGYSNAGSRAFPTKPISRPTTPTSKPTTSNRAQSRGHGASSSGEQDAMEDVMRGRRGEVRKKASNRSMRRADLSEQASMPPRVASRSRQGEGLAHSSSFQSQKSFYESDGEVSDAPSRSRSQHRGVDKQSSSRSLKAAYDVKPKPPVPTRSPARSVERHARSPGSFDRDFAMPTPVMPTPVRQRARFDLADSASDVSSIMESSPNHRPYATALGTSSPSRSLPSVPPATSAAQALIQRPDHHIRSGSENSFLSVDPMSSQGGINRAPSPLSRAPSTDGSRPVRSRSREARSRGHTRAPSDVSASSRISGERGIDDSVRAGLAARKRSGSVSSIGEDRKSVV